MVKSLMARKGKMTDEPTKTVDETKSVMPISSNAGLGCPNCGHELDEKTRQYIEIGKRWRENSSLEAWFPFSAERLARLEATKDKAWIGCPFCSMPNVVEAVFDKDSMTYAAQCPDCYACGPVEETPEAALLAWRRRAHDVEWMYRKARALSDRWCDAIGQYDEKKRENLAISIAEDLAA